MSMGSVGLSAAGAPVPSDLEAIYQGGDFFLDRMKAMADARDAAKKALDALNLGNDIAAARTQAQALLDAATAATADAAQVVDDAKVAAKKLISDAKAQAESIIQSATAMADDITAKATAAKKKSDKDIADATARVQALLADAQAKQAGIDVLTAASQLAISDAKQAQAAAEVATKAANDAQKLYEGKVAKLQAVIG